MVEKTPHLILNKLTNCIYLLDSYKLYFTNYNRKKLINIVNIKTNE